MSVYIAMVKSKCTRNPLKVGVGNLVSVYIAFSGFLAYFDLTMSVEIWNSISRPTETRKKPF